MKVLLINGSPNEHGCIYTVLHKVETTLRRHGIGTELLYLGMEAARRHGIEKSEYEPIERPYFIQNKQ